MIPSGFLYAEGDEEDEGDSVEMKSLSFVSVRLYVGPTACVAAPAVMTILGVSGTVGCEARSCAFTFEESQKSGTKG